MTAPEPPKTSPLVSQYREAYARHGDSPSAVFWPRGRQQLRFDALTRHISGDGFSVLDYGCGLAHLKPYLDTRFSRYQYCGADLVPEFVEAASRKYPDSQVRLVRSHDELSETVDHVVISGTFNIIEGGNAATYLAQVQDALAHLFGLCRASLAVNFMTDQVDYVQDGAHHVNVEEMYRFFRDHLSPRLLLDQSYMPYEFTIIALRNRGIVRPDNIYEPL